MSCTLVSIRSIAFIVWVTSLIGWGSADGEHFHSLLHLERLGLANFQCWVVGSAVAVGVGGEQRW